MRGRRKGGLSAPAPASLAPASLAAHAASFLAHLAARAYSQSPGIAVAWTRPGANWPEIIGTPHLSLTPDGKTPGISRRIWSDVSRIAELVKRPDFPSGQLRESGDVIVPDGSSHLELPSDPTRVETRGEPRIKPSTTRISRTRWIQRAVSSVSPVSMSWLLSRSFR